MATLLALRISALQTDVRQQRALIEAQKVQIAKQQSVLDIQFRRIADIQAELDMVKAAVRAAAPAVAAPFIHERPERATVSPTSFSASPSLR
jgi:hypothetical protein